MSCHREKQSADPSAIVLAAAEAIHGDGSPCLLSQPRDDVRRMIDPHAAVRPKARPEQAPEPLLADHWRVVVLNDPVNRMSYVVMVLRRVLGFDEARARQHMLEVHEQGRSVVWTGTREQAEAYMFALQQWHLTAIIQPDEAA
jgi:ATP-dependent Clp protease adaptor protein ClpS